jgi:hypothetical protein
MYSQHLSAGSSVPSFAMQFALPPRQSTSPPYTRSTRLSLLRRRQLKTIAVFGLALLTIFYLLSFFLSASDSLSEVTPDGTPNVVIITLFDRDALSDSHIQMITKNREYYATQHGMSYAGRPYLLLQRLPLTFIQATVTSSLIHPITYMRSGATSHEVGPSSQPFGMLWPHTLTARISFT